MTATGDAQLLDRDELARAVRPAQQLQRALRRRLHRRPVSRRWHALRETGPVHEGIVHELTGYPGDCVLPGPAVPRPAALLGVQLRGVRRRLPRRRGVRVARRPRSIDTASRACSTASSAHGRHAAPALPRARAAVVRAGRRRSGGSTTGSSRPSTRSSTSSSTTGAPSSTSTSPPPSRCSPSPAASASTSSRRSIIRAVRSISDTRARSSTSSSRSSPPAASSRRTTSSACWSRPRYTDEDGVTHRLTDAEILSFALLLLAAGSGHHVEADGHHARRAARSGPTCSPRCATTAQLLRPAIEESRALDADRPDVLPLRHRATPSFFGVHMPEGSVVHLCLGAANRDPARWDRPDEYDITRAAEAVARVRQRPARVPRACTWPGPR